jgi:hypothetical protein
MFWRIGNGRSVRIWGDKWVPRPSTFTVQSSCNILPQDGTVRCLIEGNPPKWNSNLIREIFNEDEAEIICGLPMSRFLHEDKIIWFASMTGDFTMKGAYHLEKERHE